MCTRILWNDNGVAHTVARTLDWAVSDEPRMWFVPRGTDRVGGPQPGAATWTSRHASLVLSMWDAGTVDGVNEDGLAAHVLYLDPEDVELPAADGRPTVAHVMWAQYMLDHFSTVAEVVAASDDLALVSVPFKGQDMGAHLAVEDATGDSAIIEPIGGRLVVHHGRQYRVMANSPSLDDQLTNLARYRDFGGELPPPGDITSLDRFVRASYFLGHLPTPETRRQAVAGLVQLIDNVAVPFGAPYSDGGVYPTWWRAIVDLTHREYFFGSTFSPTIFWVAMATLADGDRVLCLDPEDEELAGDVSSRFAPAMLPY